MAYEPQRCYGCGSLVEITDFDPRGITRIPDKRVRHGEVVFAPPLCWDCRGVVLLEEPPEGVLIPFDFANPPDPMTIPRGAFPVIKARYGPPG